VLAVVSAPALPLLLIEIALAIAVAAPGVLIAKVGVRVRHPLRVGVLLPEIVLAGALVYLGVAMPVFHAAGISYQVGLAQFLAVLPGWCWVRSGWCSPVPPLLGHPKPDGSRSPWRSVTGSPSSSAPSSWRSVSGKSLGCS